MDRDRLILRHLATHEGWTTSSALASAAGCSVRTVKSDIAKLNKMYPGIIGSGRKGFCIGNRALLAQVDPQGANPIPETPDERRAAILRALLMGRREVSLEDLADEMCVSTVTLTKDLARLKLDLSEHGLGIRTRDGLLFVTGGEENERRMLSSLIFDETKDFFNQVDAVGTYFPDLDLGTLRDEVEEALERHHFFLNDYALSNFLLHLAIVAERSINGFAAADGDASSHPSIDADATKLVADICTRVEQRYGITITKNDRIALGLILATRIESRSSDGSEFVGEDTLELVRTIVSHVSTQYAISLEGEAFLIRFGLHLKNMLLRLSEGSGLRNPQTSSIRNDYPFVYDIAVSIAQVVNEERGVSMPDDEIAYVALHIGCLIEEQRDERAKVHAMLVCPTYNFNGVQLAWRIQRTFEDSLVVDGVVSELDRLPVSYTPELIISTSHLDPVDASPCVEISPFLGARDLATLRVHLESLRTARRRSEMEERLRTLFRPELFLYDDKLHHEDEVIEALGDALIEAGCVRDDFKDGVREREAISSSAYLDVAIPHPLDMDALESAIAVSVHPHLLDWAGTPVHLVLMLAIRAEDRPVFRSIFDFVTDALYDPHHMDQITAATSFEVFLDTLLSYA